MPENDVRQDHRRRRLARLLGPVAMVAVALLLHLHFTEWTTQCEPPAMLYLWESGPTSDLGAPCPAGYYFGLMPAPGTSVGTAFFRGIVLPLVLLAATVMRVWRTGRRRSQPEGR